MTTGKGSGRENRRHGRLNRTFTVEISALSFPMSGVRGLETRCYDISSGGLSIESSKSFNPGERLQARINIPMLNKFSPSFFKIYENDADQYLTAIVEVIWCKPGSGGYLVGMRYINVDEDQARALAGMINKAFRQASEKKV